LPKIEKNEFIQAEDEIWQSLDSLGLKPGISRFIPNVKITKIQKFQGLRVLVNINVSSKYSHQKKSGLF
jgi:hypothetical protein